MVLAGSDVAMGSLRDRVSEEGIGLVFVGLKDYHRPQSSSFMGLILKILVIPKRNYFGAYG